jgi:hypothetical protein
MTMEFIATIPDLKRALSVVSMAVGEGSETISGHALFDVKDNQIFIYSTDNDKMAATYLPVSSITADKDVQFTADPKRIQKLISSSDSDIVKFTYDDPTKTLNIFVSENSESYVSFASFEPENFLTFDKDLEGATEVRTIDATVLKTGIKFIQGFLPDKDTSKKYSNLYIIDGTMFGSNGSFKIGAFENEDLKDTNLTIRSTMLPSIISLIDLTSTSDIVLLETAKITIISTKDRLNSFAFRKITIATPKFPLSTKIPEAEHFNVDCNALLKKLTRLSLTSKDEIGIKINVSSTDMSMETVADRKSYEKMLCKRDPESTALEFILECGKFKGILNSFQASNAEIYLDNSKCIIYSDASLLVEETGKEPVSKKFLAIGLLSLAKVL